MLISFFTLILAFCLGILSGLFFRKRFSAVIAVILAWLTGACATILLTYAALKILLWSNVIGGVNPDWFIRQCVWLAILALFGVLLSAKAFKKSEAMPTETECAVCSKRIPPVRRDVRR